MASNLWDRVSSSSSMIGMHAVINMNSPPDKPFWVCKILFSGGVQFWSTSEKYWGYTRITWCSTPQLYSRIRNERWFGWENLHSTYCQLLSKIPKINELCIVMDAWWSRTILKRKKALGIPVPKVVTAFPYQYHNRNLIHFIQHLEHNS